MTTWGTPIDEASTDHYVMPPMGTFDEPVSFGQPASPASLSAGSTVMAGALSPDAPESETLNPGHRSPDRSLLVPSVARSVVGGLVAVAVILSGILAINWIQRDDVDDSSLPAARTKSASSSARPGSTSSASSTKAPTTKSTGKATSAKPAPAPPAESGPASAESSPAEPAPTKAEAAALRIPLTVLNNSRIAGLAATARDDFRAAGWTVPTISGTTYQPKVTTVYYLPGQEASARQLMRDVPRVQRMLVRPKSLPGKGLTVVVTREYVGK
ncbi:MAG: LytR C-terminal domain-containing protein [Mycobacteriales bacterium]